MTTIPNRFLTSSALFAAIALAAAARAQDKAPSPSPSPSPAASASPREERVSPVDRPVVIDADDLAADILGVTVQAERGAAAARRSVDATRALIEREARRAAKNAAEADTFLSSSIGEAARAAAEVGSVVARAVAEAGRSAAELDNVRSRALTEAGRAAAEADHIRAQVLAEAEAMATTAHENAEARAEREAAVREALLEVHQTAKEKEIEARERAREKQREAQEKAREKQQEALEQARERQQEAQERAREKQQEAQERAREAQQNARERAREADQARRERERDRQIDQSDRIDELYDQAMEAIDDEDWGDALRPLSRLMSLNSRVDAALYWTSYAQYKMDRTAAALATLARLQKDFPASRWSKEGKALEMEARGKSGQAPRPDQLDQEDDLDLKLMAVSALAQSDPQEAMPLLSKILSSPSSPRKIRERSLFVLAQMGSEQAGNAIAEVARGNSSPELQRKAIQYLGVFGGAGNRKVLSEIYATSGDNTIRKQILNSFMVSGDKARVLNAAKTEKDPVLRGDAIRLLGVMGGSAELSQMYTTAATPGEKKNILQALFVGGAIEPVAAAARGEKDKEVRLVAVRNLGLMGRKSQDVLGELYRVETDPEVKKEVLNAFFLQGNVTKLIEVARVEKDPLLKKEAVHWLSLMNSKESRAYMLELLKD